MILGTIGGILFALGMCMALIPEWNAFRPGGIMAAAGLAVLLLYLWLMARAAVLANRVSVNFAAQLVLAASLTIVFQALFHIGIVTGAMPVSGQPLPLISKGGTSILITSIAFGIMLSVSRHATRKGARKKEIEQEESMLPKEMSAANPTQL